MEKTLQTFRYLSKSLMVMIAIGFLTILGNIAVSDLVFFLTDHYNTIPSSGPLMAYIEITAGIFALLIGLVVFLINFKVALANGISRKTFLLANIPAIAMVAAAFSIFNLVVVLIHGLFWPMTLATIWIYPQAGWVGALVLQFALYYLWVVVGWFIALAYYRSNTPVKWAISLAPFVVFGLLQVANAQSGGAVFAALAEYIRLSMGTAGGTPNPYQATFSMLVYSAILYGLTYLLLRRTPLKD
jgi:hypothetical protein